MNPYIWCAVGALIGWAAGLFMAAHGRSVVIENVLVGAFGAFIGGDAIVSLLSTGVVDPKVFKIGSLGIAIATSVAMLGLLQLMRHAVGPMKNGKSRAKDRR